MRKELVRSFPSQDNSRISVQLQLPIGATRKEVAQAGWAGTDRKVAEEI